MMPLAARAPETIAPPPHDGPRSAPIRFETLNLMRALAVLGVLFFHVNELFIPFGEKIRYCTYYGYLGVQMFFVISGFCMMASVVHFRRQGLDGVAFLRRRMIRIYPPFWLALGFTVLQSPLKNVCLGLADPFAAAAIPYARLSPGDWFGFVSLGRIYFSRGMAASNAFQTINPVYWSLAIEVQFYLIVYLFLAWPARARLVMWSVTLAGVASSFLAKAYASGSFLPHWPAFALGIGIYAALERGLTPSHLLPPRLVPAAPFVALAALLGYMNRAGCAIGDQAHWFYLLFAIFVWTLYPFDEQLTGLQSSALRPVAWAARFIFGIGTISYSIYLMHIPVVDLFDTILSHFLGRGVGYTLLLLSATLAFCYPFYVFCEQPFISAGRPRKKAGAPATQPAGDTPASC